MAGFFRPSAVWAIAFGYDGRPRRWFREFGIDVNVRETIRAELHDLFGERAKLEEVRLATDEEQIAYLRGEEPRNAFCPVPGRRNTK